MAECKSTSQAFLAIDAWQIEQLNWNMMYKSDTGTSSIADDIQTSEVHPQGLAFDEETLKRYGHQVMDTVASYLSGISGRPVWQPMPHEIKQTISEQQLPEQGQAFEEIVDFIQQIILPYPQGNGHPRFAGWINSAPSHAGVLVKPLAAAMNPNCGIGDHAGQALERRTVQWMMELCGFPVEGSAGVFVSGGSEANFTCLQAARQWATQVDGWNVRKEGMQGSHAPLVLYQSDQGHFCVRKAAEAMGLGTNSVHIVPSTPSYQMDVPRLRARVREDRAAGLRPFCVCATAGTVETGAIDPLDELADLCAEEGLWLHVDGAYGAFGIMDEQAAPLYKGIERIDSMATDQHKWLSIPIDCGCALVRRGSILREAFSLTQPPVEDDDPWMSEYTLQRTRRFRALEAWAVVCSAGRSGLAEAIIANRRQARLMESLIQATPDLELVAQGPLSIVRFRYLPAESQKYPPEQIDQFNRALVHEIQLRGNIFLTSTRFFGKEVIRACLVNHMTTDEDIHAMVHETSNVAHELMSSFF
jgi:glutamate/tyrosine decarboxylase-like PLP-dependent enzyme